MSGLELANRLKNYFVSVTSDDPALDYLTLPAFLPAPEELPVIRPTEVYKKLLRLSPFKACGPDAIPNRILKLFASELSDPVTTTGSPRRGGMPIYHQYQRRHPSPVIMTCDQ